MNLPQAQRVADEIVAELARHCERIEVAGSVRRKKHDGIKDVEIVCIARPGRPEFGKPATPPLHRHVDELRARGVLMQRTPVAWGERYRRVGWLNGRQTAVSLDLFVTTPECWGVIFALRTGPGEFSRRLVTSVDRGGALPIGWTVEGGRLWCDDGRALATPEERDAFTALGLPWIPPHERTEQRLIELLKVRA